jgi:uncharacterized membrane protein (Fun14 family)
MADKASNIQDTAVGIFHRAKTSALDWLNSLDLNSRKVIEIVSFFGIGFFSGFLLKKYFRYVLLSLIVLTVVAFILENSSIIHIDWNRVRSILGIASTDTIDSIFYVSFDWVKANVVSSISALIGFVIGYKVG